VAVCYHIFSYGTLSCRRKYKYYLVPHRQLQMYHVSEQHQIVSIMSSAKCNVLFFDTVWRLVDSFTFRPLNPQEKVPGTHWTGGCVGLRAGLDTEANSKICSPGGNRCHVIKSADSQESDRATPARNRKQGSWLVWEEQLFCRLLLLFGSKTCHPSACRNAKNYRPDGGSMHL
jgi:hypothetical protein